MEYGLSKKKKLKALKEEMLKYCLKRDRDTFLRVFIGPHSSRAQQDRASEEYQDDKVLFSAQSEQHLWDTFLTACEKKVLSNRCRLQIQEQIPLPHTSWLKTRLHGIDEEKMTYDPDSLVLEALLTKASDYSLSFKEAISLIYNYYEELENQKYSVLTQGEDGNEVRLYIQGDQQGMRDRVKKRFNQSFFVFAICSLGAIFFTYNYGTDSRYVQGLLGVCIVSFYTCCYYLGSQLDSEPERDDNQVPFMRI